MPGITGQLRSLYLGASYSWLSINHGFWKKFPRLELLCAVSSYMHISENAPMWHPLRHVVFNDVKKNDIRYDYSKVTSLLYQVPNLCCVTLPSEFDEYSRFRVINTEFTAYEQHRKRGVIWTDNKGNQMAYKPAPFYYSMSNEGFFGGCFVIFVMIALILVVSVDLFSIWWCIGWLSLGPLCILFLCVCKHSFASDYTVILVLNRLGHTRPSRVVRYVAH